ncbi:MAG: ATP-binding cassette domain-containing protein, partial [Gemmatimonadota bacterium]|nr:ATP-binding cassette domain-containing protein [Gemmatimonadota bacterium]
MTDVALELASITVRFGRTMALDNASLSARCGTVHALLGENGAGKTTLMRVAFGMLRHDSGTIRVDGTPRTFRSPSDAIAAGIGMVHQHFTLVPAMTVAENIALGGRGMYAPEAARRRILELSARTGLATEPSARIEDLTAGAQQRVEILKALSHDSKILILDEPTAVLTPLESRELLRKAREMVSEGGTAILITHKLRDALEFADDITVLRRGRTVWSGRAGDATQSSLVAAMLGGEHVQTDVAATRVAGLSSAGQGDALMSLRDVGVRDSAGVDRLRSVNLDVRAGEILGVAGVEGNGQRELLRLLAGRLDATSGAVSIPGVVGFVPEDRQRDALIEDQSLRDNVALFGAGARTGIMRWRVIREHTRALLQQYGVRSTGDNARARSLSGGNQQKFVLGREMQGSLSAIVVENPSRGLDVQATVAVRVRLRGARDAGMAVVVYSSDLEEVIS